MFTISVFWDITSYSPLNVNPRFRGTCSLHLQSRRISQIINLHESGTNCCFLTWLILRTWRWRRYIAPKCKLTFIKLRSIIFQKTLLFIFIAVCTSDPTRIKLSTPRYDAMIGINILRNTQRRMGPYRNLFICYKYL
jgi:hypothetical protein